MLFCDLMVHQWVIGPWCFKKTWRFHLSSVQMSKILTKIRSPTCCCTTSRTNYIVVQYHIPEEQMPQLYHCKRLDTCKGPIVSGLLNNVSPYDTSDSKQQEPFTCTWRWTQDQEIPPILENIKAKHSNISTIASKLQSITVVNKFFILFHFSWVTEWFLQLLILCSTNNS